MVRGILFDAAGVLYERPRHTSQYLAALLTEMGLPGTLSPGDRLRQKALKSEGSRGIISPEEYWDRVLRMHGVRGAGERQSLREALDRHADDVWPMPGCAEALATLKQRGFVLCIVTDTMHSLKRKMQWLAKVGAAPYVDFVACSTVVGVHKPEAGIYLDALRQAGLAPGQAAFVGHDAVELEGARRVGLTTVAVHHDADARADYYATSLSDLLELPLFEAAASQGDSR